MWNSCTGAAKAKKFTSSSAAKGAVVDRSLREGGLWATVSDQPPPPFCGNFKCKTDYVALVKAFALRCKVSWHFRSVVFVIRKIELDVL